MKTHRSEDLWVQVESSDAEAPHIEAGYSSGRGESEGEGQPCGKAAYVRIALKPRSTWKDPLLN